MAYYFGMKPLFFSKTDLLLDHVRNNEVEKIRELVEGNQELLKYRYGGRFEGKTIIQVVCSTFSNKVTEQTVKALIDLGADLCEYDDIYEYQSIHWAALSFNAELLRTICTLLGPKQIDNTTKKGHYTALSLIIDRCDCESDNILECIEVLLEHNVEINTGNCMSGSPIFGAATKGYRRIVGLLLSRYPGIDIDGNSKYASVTARDLIIKYNLYDHEKLPPFTEKYLVLREMFKTLREGREDDFLKFKNIESFVDEGFEGKAMLDICAELNLLKCARHLVELGAHVYDPRNILEWQLNPVYIAARNGSFQVFEELSINLKAIPNFLLIYNDAPQTVKTNFNKSLRLLLRRNKSLANQKDLSGYRPLDWAKDEDVIKILVYYGACKTSISEKILKLMRLA